MSLESDTIIVATQILSSQYEGTDDGWFAGDTWCTLCAGTGFRHVDRDKEREIVHKENCPVAAAKRLLNTPMRHEKGGCHEH